MDDYGNSIHKRPNKGYFSVDEEYRNILPEIGDITWDDGFFRNEGEDADVVAAFDFDYEQMVDFFFQTQLLIQLVLVGALSAYILILAEVSSGILWQTFVLLGLDAILVERFLLRQQIKWQSYAQHIAVTRDGIRYVNDKQKSCWGIPIFDIGKNSKTVPFDKITDCDISEPAGNSCLFIPNVLMVVNVDTASSGGEGKRHELVIKGLKDPYSFKKLVWAMKRSREVGGLGYRAPTATATVEMASSSRATASVPTQAQLLEAGCSSDENISGLLRDIRDELRQNNDLLRQQRNENLSPPKPYFLK